MNWLASVPLFTSAGVTAVLAPLAERLASNRLKDKLKEDVEAVAYAVDLNALATLSMATLAIGVVIAVESKAVNILLEGLYIVALVLNSVVLYWVLNSQDFHEYYVRHALYIRLPGRGDDGEARIIRLWSFPMCVILGTMAACALISGATS